MYLDIDVDGKIITFPDHCVEAVQRALAVSRGLGAAGASLRLAGGHDAALKLEVGMLHAQLADAETALWTAFGRFYLDDGDGATAEAPTRSPLRGILADLREGGEGGAAEVTTP